MKINTVSSPICFVSHYDSPFGRITFSGTQDALCSLWFETQRPSIPDTKGPKPPVETETLNWLKTYSAGIIPSFTLPLYLNDTPFRMQVWKILQTIPCGTTCSYGSIASAIAETRGITRMSSQAVGNAVGHNPISLIVPCHRVIGSDGSLVGYAGGCSLKAQLLDHEAHMTARSR